MCNELQKSKVFHIFHAITWFLDSRIIIEKIYINKEAPSIGIA